MNSIINILVGIVGSSFLIGALMAGLVAYFVMHRLRSQHHTQVQLLHNLPVGMVYEYEGQLVMNKVLCLMWNIAKKPHTFGQFLTLIPADEQNRFLNYYTGLVQKNLPFDALLKRGQQIFYVRGRPFEHRRHLLWITDMTSHQKQLDDLNKKIQQLERQKNLLQQAWENFPLPVFIHQGEDNIIFANRAASKEEGDVSQLHWFRSEFKYQQQNYTLTFGQETRTEEEVQSMFHEVASAHQRLCKELPCAACLFNAKGQLMACSSAFAQLWNLDEEWLKAPQDYENFWDTLQEKGLLSRVVDFAQYKKAQREQFAELTQTEEVFLYLPDGRIVRRLMIPFAQGGVILLDEDKTA